MSSQPLLLNLSQAAELLGLNKQQLYELTRTRSRIRQAIPLPHVRLGKRLAFRRESLERWIEQLESTAVQPCDPNNNPLQIETAVRMAEDILRKSGFVRLNKGVKHEFSR